VGKSVEAWERSGSSEVVHGRCRGRASTCLSWTLSPSSVFHLDASNSLRMDDDTGPVVFKRKGKGGQRARATRTDDAPDDAEKDEGTESPATLASKLKKKARGSRPATPSKLSFGADEEDEVRVSTAALDVC
jgi:hypothetical protein